MNQRALKLLDCPLPVVFIPSGTFVVCVQRMKVQFKCTYIIICLCISLTTVAEVCQIVLVKIYACFVLYCVCVKEVWLSQPQVKQIWFLTDDKRIKSLSCIYADTFLF